MFNLARLMVSNAVQQVKPQFASLITMALPLFLISYTFLLDRTIGLLLILVLTGVLKASYSRVALDVIENKKTALNQAFSGFTYFKNSLGVFLLSLVFIIAGFLLFIIPGFIVMIWLSQSFFILAENPEMEPMDVFHESRRLIKGHEIPLIIIAVFFGIISVTLGIVGLPVIGVFLFPLQYVALANFYKYIKSNQIT